MTMRFQTAIHAGISLLRRDLSRGIIPAHAGSTRRGVPAGLTARDHPRACGEHPNRHVDTAEPEGSSPRMRGAPLGASLALLLPLGRSLALAALRLLASLALLRSLLLAFACSVHSCSCLVAFVPGFTARWRRRSALAARAVLRGPLRSARAMMR